MRDRNDEPPYPIDAISLLKTDHRKVKNLASIMASATPFCCCTMQKHLAVERTRDSRP